MSRSSSCDAWPETWTNATPSHRTSAPWRRSWFTTRVIVRSWPGMTRAERMTRSPSITWRYLCSAAAMSASAECGSPWLPVEMITCR